MRSHGASILASAVPQQKWGRRIMRCVPRHRRVLEGPKSRYLRAAEQESRGTSALFAPTSCEMPLWTEVLRMMALAVRYSVCCQRICWAVCELGGS